MNTKELSAARKHHAPTRELLAVALVATAVSIINILACNLWVVPTSIEYLELTNSLLVHGDFRHELFLLRTPAYPILLAAVFELFGSASAIALQVIQHAMTILAVFFATLTAWEITERRSVTLLTGLLGAGSLQVIAFANQVMTETPFLCFLTVSTYYLVRHVKRGHLIDIAIASLTASIAYLFRPIGMSIVALCPMVAVLRWWLMRKKTDDVATGPRTFFRPVFAAIIPAVFLISPWMIDNQLTYGSNSFARCLDFALYNRAVYIERPDATNNPALRRLQNAVAESKKRGDLPDTVDDRLAWTAWQAMEKSDGKPLSESSAMLGKAARTAILDDPAGFVVRSIKYCVWMLLSPDVSYRYLPGGATGKYGHRPKRAEIFDAGIYLKPFEQPLRNYAPKLSLSAQPGPTTPAWTQLTKLYHRSFTSGPKIGKICNSPYELFALFCLAGGVLALFTRQRASWAVVIAVIALQVIPSATLAGVGPRYSVPQHLLMKTFAALLLVTIASRVWQSVRHLYAQRSTVFGKTILAGSA